MKSFSVDIPESVLEQFRSERETKQFIADAIAKQLVESMTLTLEVRIGEES